MTGKKYEPPLHLDMDFAEALKRFGKTEKEEVDKSIERAKKKKPPGPKAPTTKHRKTATPSRRRKSNDNG